MQIDTFSVYFLCTASLVIVCGLWTKSRSEGILKFTRLKLDMLLPLGVSLDIMGKKMYFLILSTMMGFSECCWAIGIETREDLFFFSCLSKSRYYLLFMSTAGRY